MNKCRFCGAETEDSNICDNTVCKAREELGEHRKMFYQVKRYRARLHDLKDKFYGLKAIDYSKIKFGQSADQDRMLSMVAKIEELEYAISSRILAAAQKGMEIERKIDKLPYPYNEILVKRYIEFKTFERIAVEMGYCFKQICRNHDKAVKMYAEIERCPIMSYDGVL